MKRLRATLGFLIVFSVLAGAAMAQMGFSPFSGDVTWSKVLGYFTSGPSSATDNAVPRFDGTSGKSLQGSGVTITDDDGMNIPGPVSIGATLSAAAISTPYGVSWNEDQDTYQRLGVSAGDFLPIQSAMRRCILNDAGVRQYYLCSTNSTLKEDCTTPAVLDGTDGQVMVEIPKFYLKYTYTRPYHQWQISTSATTGFSVHPAFVKDGAEVNYRYIGAYEGVLYDTSASRYADGIYQSAFSCTFASADKSITANARTAPFANLSVGDKITVSGTTSNNNTVTVATLISGGKVTVTEALTDETAAATVIQTQKNWTATTGDRLSSVSGKTPITYGTRAQFRVAASNRGSGWRQLDYDLYSAIQLLYLIEYASFNSQSVIGVGITTVTDWAVYNDSSPITRTGNSNAVGNATGNTAGSTTCAAEVSDYLTYRGIENWFGHVWKWVDGININANVPYVTNTATNWADDTSTNYTSLGVTLGNADGYQSTLAQTSRGYLPLSVGASSNTKITDYYYQSAGWRVVIVGGGASYGGYAGAFCVAASNGSGVATQYFSGRLCY